MNSFLDNLIRWSEVWALLVPLTIIIFYKSKLKEVSLIVIYIGLALVLNVLAILISTFQKDLPAYLQNNNILYNIHSVLRVLLFGLYIKNLSLLKSTLLPKIVLTGYLVFVFINSFLESPLQLSSSLLSAESIVLLLLAFAYFFRSMQDESKIDWLKHPSFLVCSAICIYEALSFFIFLFFYPLIEQNWELAVLTMKIFSLAFILFCCLLAAALFKSSRPQKNEYSHK